MKTIALLLCLISTSALANVVGVSAHPFTMKKQVITTEFNSFLNNGSGVGLAARYYHKLNETVNLDAGVGIASGDRANRIFAGADMMLFPDYGRQPRVSVKGLVETMSFNGSRVNAFGIAPTVSKGFSFWGKEAFPFIALPLKVNMNTKSKTYLTSSAIAMGITGRVPFNGYNKLIGSLETQFSLQDSYSSIVLGFAIPIQ